MTENLNSKNGPAVMELLTGLHKQGTTICIVTLDQRFTERANHTVHLFDGRVVDRAEATVG